MRLTDTQRTAIREEVQRHFGEQRIDLVVHRAGSPVRPIDREAQDTDCAMNEAQKRLWQTLRLVEK